jgi:PBSX family phage terminase large subunit
MKHEIDLLHHQKAALMSNKKKTLMLCGIGSGKSFLGAIWTLKKLKESPKSMGLITANTYGQLQKATLETCFNLYNQLGIDYNYNKQLSLLTIADTKRFLCLSTENYDTHRGIEVGEWWGDEAAYYSLDAYKVLSGRIRCKNAKRDMLFTTTPKGMNWIYDYFHPLGQNCNHEDTSMIVAKTRDNIHLPGDYENTLRKEYGDNLSKQELDAEFVKLGSGITYYAFTDKNLSEGILKRLNDIVYVGLDFNVNPYCGVLCHYSNDTLEVFDEIYLENSNTPSIIDAIRQKVGNNLVRIIPDSTQFKRNTIGITDIEMLRQHYEIVPTRNPFVIDRVNNVNRLFEQTKITISKKCVRLINDLNKVTWREHATELDQVTDRMLTHTSDALGYVAWCLMPFLKKIPPRSGHYA